MALTFMSRADEDDKEFQFSQHKWIFQHERDMR